jgi:hypothetical protein
LHASLKNWYAIPGDQTEVAIDGYMVDLVRGDLLVEFQTRSFGSMRTKLANLLERHPVRLVYPLAKEKWIVRQNALGEIISRRRSPKHGTLLDIFSELLRIPHLLGHPNFTFEVLFIASEDVWQDDGKGSWTRKFWSIADRRLLNVIERVVFTCPADFTALLPAGLVDPFTNNDLAAALKCRKDLPHKMTYTLLRAGELVKCGKRGNSVLFQRRQANSKK